MVEEIVLDYIRSLLEQLHISTNTLPRDNFSLYFIDFDLRKSLGIFNNQEIADVAKVSNLCDNKIYYIEDVFSCRYVAICLPDGMIFTAGPYILSASGLDYISFLTQRYSLDAEVLNYIKGYFKSIPRLSSDSILTASFNALAGQVFGEGNYSSETIIHGLSDSWVPLIDTNEFKHEKSFLAELREVENRYAMENRVIQAVANGQSKKAIQLINSIPVHSFEVRNENPVRNEKNYCIIFNTLLRKAVEQAGVHPYYINQVSSDSAFEIERAETVQQVNALHKKMAEKYSALVKKTMSEKHSPLVESVLLHIDYDISADLGLCANAELTGVSPGYLSSLFKREMGVTLTDYVNRKRAERGAYLLSATNLPIATIGIRCGILDDNYFTKIFKKYIGVTPSAYRSKIVKPHLNKNI